MPDISTPKLFDESLRGVSGIYLIQHIASKKVYVGSSNNFAIRRSAHFCSLKKGNHGNHYLQAAYIKYGRKAFSFRIIEECAVDALVEREQFWIDYYQSASPKHGYNIVPRADRKALSNDSIRKSAEARKGLTPWNKGMKYSAELREKLSKSHIGRKTSPETLAKLRGRKLKPETIEKMRKKRSPETREKLRLAALARWANEDSRKKQSERCLGRPVGPEAREKIRASLTGFKHSSEARKNMSNAQKRRAGRTKEG